MKPHFFYENWPKTRVFTQKNVTFFGWNWQKEWSSFRKKGEFHKKRWVSLSKSEVQRKKVTFQIPPLKTWLSLYSFIQNCVKKLHTQLHLIKMKAKCYEFQNWMFKAIETTCFSLIFFPVSRFETKKIVTILDYQKAHRWGGFPKIRPSFWSSHSREHFTLFSETVAKLTNEWG